MDPELRKVEERLAAIAGANHGIVTREQMLRAEISDQEIKGRVGNGSLIRVHRGVYRVGHAAPSVDARYMAAVLACGHGAVLSGLPAAWMYRLIKGNPRRPEVTAPTERRVAGVIVHRSRIIRVSELRGVPIATVPDTLIAITSRLDEPDLGRAVHEARVLYGTKPEHIPKPWPKKLRLILNGDTRITLSELERAFVALLKKYRLPLPQTNINVDGRYVDCRWPEYNLTVELDGYAAHDSRHAWRQDRRREREAYARGDQFRRYIYEDVVVDPTDMLGELRPLLRR